MNSKQKKRFKKLIKYFEWLNENEPSAFNIQNWIKSHSEENLNRAIEEWQDRAKKKTELNCGTAACVVGHLPNIFPKKFKWINKGASGCVIQIESEGLDEKEFLSDHFGGTKHQWKSIIFSFVYPEHDGNPPLSVVLKRIKSLYKELKKENISV